LFSLAYKNSVELYEAEIVDVTGPTAIGSPVFSVSGDFPLTRTNIIGDVVAPVKSSIDRVPRRMQAVANARGGGLS